jgi:uncharacterized repeat protein (TIGR01451 family)
MKKIFPVILSIGILIPILLLYFEVERAFGAATNIPIRSDERDGTEQIGPPWLDDAWLYRIPVVINSSTALPWYQVLVILDNSNFNFNRAKSNGADIRFTHSDGTTELNYWIESWDSLTQLAYLWVKVPAIADGETTIYLYYKNPNALSKSNGLVTFDSFDDGWSQFIDQRINLVEGDQGPDSNDDINSPFTWAVIGGTPVVSPPGILNLGDGTGIKSTSTYQYQAIGLRANFGSDTPHGLNGHEWAGFINGASGKRTIIGDLTNDWDDLYLSNYNTAPDIDRIIERVGGIPWHNKFHLYEVKWNAGLSIGEIDHRASSASSTAQVPNTPLPVTLYSYQDSNATLIVDWIYVRQYRNPEPTVMLGDEQGLVKLGIKKIDTPDPLRAGATLTYQLTISNTSTINAPSVVVTDTLPVNILIGPVSTSQGSCEVGSDILCNMDIPANSIANITIIVTPTIDGVITNTATVGSTGYEMDLSDNISVQETLVDSVPPNVNWEKPVNSGMKYYSYGGLVILEASATDNDQIAWVEFKYWDHINIIWVSIGTDISYPYQIPFNSNILEPNQLYQTFVLGVDRAGNRSDPYDPLQVIYIERRMPIFLPLMIK